MTPPPAKSPKVKVKDERELKEVLKAMEEMDRRRTFGKLDFYEPYPKQVDFHTMGASKRERLLMAGNQLGKTYCGAAETAMHLTGLYPKWWQGRRFNHPVRWWVAGESALLVRDGPQTLLCGTPGVKEAEGSGLIPKEAWKDSSLSRGVTDALDSVQVEHRMDGVVDGMSVVGFKSYEQGRQKFQTATLDGIWFDEEPDEEIYQEGLARTNATDGISFMTFTPLKGRTKVVLRFENEPSEQRGFVRMNINESKHITVAMKQKIVDATPAHMQQARLMGIPILGSGVIFSKPEEDVVEKAIESVPQWWHKIWGIDFGISHPFGAALIAWDKDADVIHVLHAFKINGELPDRHAARMKPIGADVPVAWPQDGTAREKTSGNALYLAYKKQELRMLDEHATWPDGGYSTEAGVLEIQQREVMGKIKYASHLSDLLEERRYYHRKDGLIVKEQDDILSALRVAVMMKRFAKPVLLGGKRPPRLGGQKAKGIDFDYF